MGYVVVHVTVAPDPRHKDGSIPLHTAIRYTPPVVKGRIASENLPAHSMCRSVCAGSCQHKIGWTIYAAWRWPAAVASSGTLLTAPPCRKVMIWVMGLEKPATSLPYPT